MLENSVVFEGDKVLSITGKSLGLYGKVEKIAQPYWERSQPPQYKIIWGEGTQVIEQILDNDDNGQPIIKTPTVLVDRHYEIGTRVVHRDGTQGTILEGQLITILVPGGASSENSCNIIIRDVPLKSLKHLPLAQKGDKFIWNDWIGKVESLTVKVTYQFECNGMKCTISSEDSHPNGHGSHNYPFPYVGEEISSLSWSYLWDAEWPDNKWFQNLFRYYRKKVKVVNVEVDSLTPKWIKKIAPQQYEVYSPLSEKTDNLPTILVDEDIQKVQYLKGNDYKSIDERSLCKYGVQEEDVIHFLENGRIADITAKEYADNGNINIGFPLELHREDTYTVIHIRNKYLIEWANGIREYTYVEPTGILAVSDPSNISLVKPLQQGTVVVEKEHSDNSKYGVVQWENSNGVVNVKWVICLNSEPELEESQHSRFDLKINEKYMYLRDLDSCPVVFQKNVSDIVAGVVVEVLADEAKLRVKLPDESEIFPWIHNVAYVDEEEYYSPNSQCNNIRPEMDNQNEEGKSECIDIEQLPFDPMGSQCGFAISNDIDKDHSYFGEAFTPRMDDFKFFTALEMEKTSFSSLPQGIWIQGFEKRPELYTAVIRGMPKTAYEDSLLVFDICLEHDFPQSMPMVCFRSFGLEINPKIQESGEVILPNMNQIVKPSENDTISIISDTLFYIQQEMLIEDPYYLVCKNGRNSGDGIVRQHCERYNEFILLNLLSYHQNLVKNLPVHWKSFFLKYYCDTLPKMIGRYETYLFSGDDTSGNTNVTERGDEMSTSGFYLSLRARLDSIRSSMPSLRP